MIKALIFDFSGVIGTDAYWLWLRENLPDFEAKKALFLEYTKQADRGIINAEEFLAVTAEYTKKDPSDVLQEIKDLIVINDELVLLLQSLHKNYKIALLSNAVHEWLFAVLVEKGLTSLFDEILISSHFKMAKPNPEFFKKALELLEVESNEVVFVDDRQGQVDAANALGMTGILYTENKALIADLKKAGIDSAS